MIIEKLSFTKSFLFKMFFVKQKRKALIHKYRAIEHISIEMRQNLYINVAVATSSSKFFGQVYDHIICYFSSSNVRSSVFLYLPSDREVNSAKLTFMAVHREIFCSVTKSKRKEPVTKDKGNHVIGVKREKKCVSESRLVGFASDWTSD